MRFAAGRTPVRHANWSKARRDGKTGAALLRRDLRRLGRARALRPELRTQGVDQGEVSLALDVPEGPALRQRLDRGDAPFRCGTKAKALDRQGLSSRNKRRAKRERVFYPLCRTMVLMKRDEIIEKLKEREADLRAQGVAHAALFGSVARGDDRPDSDIDILVDLDPAIVVTVFDYAGVKDFIAGMFERPVDVVSRESLKPRVRPRAIADAIYAF
jgi:uncharacterized protein